MLSCLSRRSKCIPGKVVCFLSLGCGVSVSGLAVCDSLVGVTASAEKQFVQPLSPQLVIDRQGWSAEFPPPIEAGEGHQPGLA